MTFFLVATQYSSTRMCSTQTWKYTAENLLMKFYTARLEPGMIDHQGGDVPNKTLHSTEPSELNLTNFR